MRVLFVAPYPLGQPRGNTVTIDRIARGLRHAGMRVTLLEPNQRLPRGKFDLVHGFHAYHAGPRALALAQRLKLPCVITLTGTDLNRDLNARDRRRVVRRVLERADALVVFIPESGRRLRGRVPRVAGRVHVIPQGVRRQFFVCGAGQAGRAELRRRWRRRFKLGEADFLFLFPGGIRAVKDPLLPLRAFPRLRRRFPRARLLFVGPLLERAYGRRFRRRVSRLFGAAYRPALAPSEMPGVYAAVDVVVNSSLSEALSNSLLEAMAVGVPVLARAVAGNRALVAHNRTGLLFTRTRDFLRQAERLLGNPALGRRLAARARQRVRRRYSLAAEPRAYLRLYRRLLGTKRRV
ncbi:MAG: glycosyltransferase [Terriglobia bacterium]